MHTEKETVTLEAGHIGYLIYCPNPFVFNQEADEVTIYTYYYVREDAIRLYGFSTRKERMLFEQLLQVSGIGPKGALAILASGAPHQVMQAIEEENEKFLMKFPGVGKKTARQMILDLKGSLKELLGDEFIRNRETEGQPAIVGEDGPLEEALEALRALGYGENEIKKVKPHIEKLDMNADEYVKKALQLMLS